MKKRVTFWVTLTIWTYLSVSYGYFTNYFVHHYLVMWTILRTRNNF
ncbi:MAG: hypothetical protein IAC08_06220 [Bacteroidetes bacterium]|uniref:Uncharacterized protein n=1 Tax=Candidatus Cryptobacteroides intestinigallinarum TaxID=2840767 RepID=A0A9D9HLD8_9BACT|nr:hypothetical protein [Candidatus Cryptobacteroides intestinigallinarum]